MAGVHRGPAPGEAEDRTARNVGVGCFTAVIGFFSGGMIAVLVGRIVEGLRGTPACEGVPICNWYVYVGWGGLLGALSLPALVLWRLRRPHDRSGNSERG